MKTTLAIVLTLGLLAAAGFAQPTVTQVSNAASSALPPLQNSSIAQGSYFAIYGNHFGADNTVCGANYGQCLWNPYPLPTAIHGASVSVTVNGTAKDAYIEFAAQFSSYSQINAVLPSDTPTGPGKLTVTYNGQSSAPFDVTVAAGSFGTFSVNQAGTGPGIITDASYVVLTPFHTAKPGQTLILWGTGLGKVPDPAAEKAAPPTQTNLCATASSCPVTVWVAGQKADVPYAGRASYTAEDQIVFVVPPGVQGCYVQVAVQTGSVIGNFTSMPVDPDGATCSDALGSGIDYNDIASVVASNGSAKVLAISMLSNYLTLNVPALSTVPLQWDNDTISGQIGTFSAYTLEGFQGFALAPSVGNCSVSPFLQYPPPSDPATAAATFLNAGDHFTFQGPNRTAQVGLDVNAAGKTVGYGGASGGDPIGGETVNQLILGCPASSTNNCAPFFLNSSFAITSGNYTVTGTGGADVGSISGSIAVSPAAAAFHWDNESTVTAGPIPRSSALTITWSGDNDPEGFVNITAISSTLQSGSTPLATTPGILVECIAPASSGSFTIPTYVLQSLPPNPIPPAGPLVPPGELLVGPASKVTKMTTPTGLDAAYIFYHFIQGQNVVWQ